MVDLPKLRFEIAKELLSKLYSSAQPESEARQSSGFILFGIVFTLC
jgi:hypothetical protein